MLASIPSPSSNGLHLGPSFVHAYGLAYIVGVIAAVAITSRRWERQGGSRELVQEVALWAFPAGLIGGRLFFLATSWNEVPDQLRRGSLAIWKGGLGIWRGIALGTLGGLLVLRRRGADIPRFMDAAAPGLLVAQAIGRIGNYFNQELFGGPTGLPWGLRIDPVHRASAYEHFATFQPTFLYELIWNLALAGTLLAAGRPTPDPRARVVRPLRRRLLGVSRPRGTPARRPRSSHPRPAAEPFRRRDPLCAGGLVWFVHIQRGSRARPAGHVRRRSGVARCTAWLICALTGCGHSHAEHAKATPHPALRGTSTPLWTFPSTGIAPVVSSAGGAGVRTPGGEAVRSSPASSCPRSPGDQREGQPRPGSWRSAPRSGRRRAR